MLKILRLPAVSRPVTWLILISFMAMLNGCYYFKVTRSTDPPKTALENMQNQQKSIILHVKDKKWYFTDIKVDQESVTGSVSPSYGPEWDRAVKSGTTHRYRKGSVPSEAYLVNEVHVYATAFTEISGDKISLPLSAIQKIEIYDKDKGATVASWIFGGLGIAAATFGAIFIIILLTKSSCPFIYTYDGNDYSFTGEIFSGATQPGLERDDYLPLPLIAASDGKYKIKITNEVHEIQSINQAELLIIDHPANKSVLVDKYGTPHSYIKPELPVSAICKDSTDIMPLIRSNDTLNYTGGETKTGNEGIEKIVMKFVRPANAESSTLIIKAKNSFWLDGLITKIHTLFGERYNKYFLKESRKSGDELMKWITDQNIPLSVYIEKNNKWEFVDYFNIAGPMAFRNDILPIDLKGIDGDTVKIKLETGFLFWELDYAGMDFSKNDPVQPVTIPISSAGDNYKTDVRPMLLNSDKEYYTQNVSGDEAFLTFEVPAQKGVNRSVFLHTRGHYQILRDLTGKVDKKTLKTFRKPNRVPAYSREMFDLLPLK